MADNFDDLDPWEEWIWWLEHADDEPEDYDTIDESIDVCDVGGVI